MHIISIDDILQNDDLIFHWTKYEFVESILKKGIMSITLMKKRGVQYDYEPDITQKLYGTDMISVVSFLGEKNIRERILERQLQCTYERPPSEQKHKVSQIFREDVTFVINPEIKTIPLGWYPYEHLVKNIIDRDYILAVSCNEEVIHQNHEKNYDDVIQDIEVLCKKYHKKFISNDMKNL